MDLEEGEIILSDDGSNDVDLQASVGDMDEKRRGVSGCGKLKPGNSSFRSRNGKKSSACRMNLRNGNSDESCRYDKRSFERESIGRGRPILSK